MSEKVFPSTRYHRVHGALRVEDATHELAVAHPDAGWATTPAAFDDDDEDLPQAATSDAPSAPWNPPAEMDEDPAATTEAPARIVPPAKQRKR